MATARNRLRLLGHGFGLTLGCGLVVAALVTTTWVAVGRPLTPGTEWLPVTRVGHAEFTGAPTQPFFFLAVGADPADSGGLGLADGIHVIGVNPAQERATILDISYDTQGPGGRKINEVLRHGLRAQADAISQLIGAPVPYAISTDFAGFAAMIDEIGGLDVTIPQPLHDRYSGADFEPGPQHLTGDQALRFVRASPRSVEDSTMRSSHAREAQKVRPGVS